MDRTEAGNTTPMEEQNFFTTFRTLLGWSFALGLPFLVYFVSARYVTGESARLYFGLLSAGIIMWIFELVDSYIVGILLVVSALVLRLAPSEVILSGYSSATFFMALGILALGSILANSGILYRLVLHILLRLPSTQFWSNISIFLLGLVVTTMLPMAGNRIEVMTHLLNEFASNARVRKEPKSATKFAINAFFSSTAFSPIFLSGSLHNFMLLGLLLAQDQERFQWIGWLEATAVCGIFLVVGFAVPQFLILWSDVEFSIDRDRVTAQLRALGPVSRIEKFAVVCFGLFAIGMVTQNIHRLPPQLIGLFILFALLVLEILTRENFQRLINWPALFLLGSLIGLMNFFEYAHLSSFIIEKLSWLGWYIKNDFEIFILMLVAIMSFVRLFMPYAPAVVIFGIVFVPMAQHYEVSSWTAAFLVLFIGKMWFFPAQFPPYEQFCRLNADNLAFNKKTILFYNLYMNLIKVLAIYISIPYWRMLGVL